MVVMGGVRGVVRWVILGRIFFGWIMKKIEGQNSKGITVDFGGAGPERCLFFQGGCVEKFDFGIFCPFHVWVQMG